MNNESSDRQIPWMEKDSEPRQTDDWRSRGSDLLTSEQEEESRPAEAPVPRILLPTDFGPATERVLKQAASLARQCRACVTLLHVIDINAHTPPDGPADPEKLRAELWQAALDKMACLLPEVEQKGVEAQAMVLEGLPWEEITEAARHFDIIAVAKPARKPFWRLFSRRTVERLLESPPCPVLLLEPARDSETEPVKLSSDPAFA